MICRHRSRLRPPDDDFLPAHPPLLLPSAVVRAGTRNSLHPTGRFLPQTSLECPGRTLGRNLCEARSPLSFAQSRATGLSTKNRRRTTIESATLRRKSLSVWYFGIVAFCGLHRNCSTFAPDFRPTGWTEVAKDKTSKLKGRVSNI
jgi:hypothetical protein